MKEKKSIALISFTSPDGNYKKGEVIKHSNVPEETLKTWKNRKYIKEQKTNSEGGSNNA